MKDYPIHTSFSADDHDRPSKAQYVWRKYRQVLEGATVLDVGGGQGHLGNLLGPESSYTSVDAAPQATVQANLEEGLPFPDESFRVVLCLDVLEHLENLHHCFDECCRVSSQWLIFSLPNAWSSFFQALRYDEQSRIKSMKQIGLPIDPPKDRHRWFFNDLEAERFLCQRGQRNGVVLRGLERIQVPFPPGLKGCLWWRLLGLIVSRDMSLERLQVPTIWALMEKAPRDARKVGTASQGPPPA